jgi:hypothetical protein
MSPAPALVYKQPFGQSLYLLPAVTGSFSSQADSQHGLYFLDNMTDKTWQSICPMSWTDSAFLRCKVNVMQVKSRFAYQVSISTGAEAITTAMSAITTVMHIKDCFQVQS